MNINREQLTEASREESSSLGEFMQEIRKRERYSLRELSEKMGFANHAYLYEVENGAKASMELIVRFIRTLELPKEDYNKLLKLAHTDPKAGLTKDETELIELLEDTGIIVAAYSGKLSQNTIKVLIKRIKNWRKHHGL